MILATWPVWPVASYSAAADTMANTPSLVISQLKITSGNGQFVTLYNPTNNTLDLSKYQLEYFNNYDLTKATSSRLVALIGTVPPHGYFMVNDSALLLCYQLGVDSLSLGFSSTAGLVEVLALDKSAGGSSVMQTVQDYVGWSKTTVAGAQTLPANSSAWLQRQPVDGQYNPLVVTAGAGSWQAVQPDSNNPCNIISVNTLDVVPTGMSQLLPPSEPPASIVATGSIGEDAATPTGLPPADVGLMTPQVTELLPNPNGTGTDSTDEFIELYNANAGTFDLSGFSLQIGTTSLHKYTFPAGTSLASKSFKAFYSVDTGLSLSNAGGQAKLLDPLGNSLSASNVYGTAKDGQAWALAKGKWYWTTTPTPNAANAIKQPPAAKKKLTAKSAKTAKKSKAAKTKLKGTAASSSGNGDEPSLAPIHRRVLVVVAGLALLYLAYEYRADLANRIYQCRQYLKNRRKTGVEA